MGVLPCRETSRCRHGVLGESNPALDQPTRPSSASATAGEPHIFDGNTGG
jgi:hypothetical protein